VGASCHTTSILLSLSLLLWTAIPSCHWPGFSHYPISLSHYTALPLILWIAHPSAISPDPHLSSHIPHWSARLLGSYITSYPFTLGSIIALMMEAARTCETSVDIDLRTRQYIPEDSELQTRRCKNLKFHDDINVFVIWWY
jgi:hypothetical protein